MSDIFTVVLDLSHVKNDSKSNQLYLAMADTKKMKNIYEFKHYIQVLFSLGCSVELFHEGVRLPDLEDIRILSHLDVVQVRLKNEEEKKDEGKKLISKSKGCNEKYGDRDPRPMPGDSVTNCSYIDSKENVCSYKSFEPGMIAQAQEVSGFGDHGKAEMSCNPSFPAGNRACSSVQKPKGNMMRNMCDMQENKTFRFGEKTEMAENLKLAALLQNRYYGWCGKPDSNIFRGKSHFQKSNEMPDLQLGEKPCLFKNNGKFTDDDGRMENKPYIPNEGDVNISKNNFKGTMQSPVKLNETNNHELCDRKPHVHRIRSKSCSRSRPDPNSGCYGSHVIPDTVQKPLTSVTADYCEKNSFTEGSFIRKPLTVEEALKILTETAAERSMTFSSNNPAFQNDGRKNQLRGAYRTFKAYPAGKNQNFQKGNFKHRTISKTHATLGKDGMAMAIAAGHNPKAVSCQPHLPKQDKQSKVNKKTGSGDKNQGNALLKGCEKLCENQNQKTESTGEVEAKTGATTNPLIQSHPTKNKKKSKTKKKAISEYKSVSHSLINDSKHFDNSHGNEIGAAGKTESETAPSNDFVNYGDVKNKMVPGDDLGEFSKSEPAFLEECSYSPVLSDIIKGKAVNGGESAGFEKSPSRELNSSRGDPEPCVRRRCSSPDKPTGVDTSSKNTSNFPFPERDARPNSRRDLQTTDPVNTEDADGTNVSNSSANSFWDLNRSGGAVAQDAAAYPFLDQQGKAIVRDDTSSKDDNKDNSESHGSPITNKVITRPNTVTDNTSAQYTRDVNFSGDGGEGGLVPSQGQADLTRNHSRVGFGTEDAAALTGVCTGSARVGGTDSASSGSRSIPTNEVVTPQLRVVESVETKESQDSHGPEGSDRWTKVRPLLSSLAGSHGKSADAAKKECVIC